jgi:predicted nucleic acid-binding protein
MGLICLDTSVLAKRYVLSPQSDAVESVVDSEENRFAVGAPCAVGLKPAMARRAREVTGRRRDRNRLRVRIDGILRIGFFEVAPLDTPILIATRQSIAEGKPPATLDALHLATAPASCADALANDDKQCARAAHAAGLRIVTST